MSRTFRLSPDREAFIDAQLASGRFADADEVMRVGLRLPEEQEAETDAALRGVDVDEVRASIEESRRGGVYLSEHEVFARPEARLTTTIDARQRRIG